MATLNMHHAVIRAYKLYAKRTSSANRSSHVHAFLFYQRACRMYGASTN